MNAPDQPKPWQPSLSPKQAAYLARCHPRPGNPRYRLLSGPRKSGKTRVALEVIADHLWTVPDAKFSVIAPTITAGDDQGCWTQLTERVLQEWIDADFGMKWISRVKTKGISRKLICKVSNQYGGVSTVQLDSLQYEHEVEARFKNKQHSGIYVSEASYYKKRMTFDILKDVLRGEQWNEWDFMMLLDTNPAEEGEDHWLYQLFYVFRLLDDLKGPDREFQKQLDLEEFFVHDNPYLTQQEKDMMYAAYGHSKDLMDRYWHGKWTKASGSSIFFDQWRPNIHVIGDFETPTNPDPDILLPEENCFQLRTGWDMGEINHAFHIAEAFDLNMKFKTRDGKEIERLVQAFKFLDEVVYINTEATLTDFVSECVEKILAWEEFLGRSINWIHWSDRSAFDRKEPINNIYQHQFVLNISRQLGKPVILQAAARGAGSMKQRVDITKRLMFERRMWVSRSRCPNLIDSFQGLQPGKGNVVIQRASPLKHAFDSATYILASECFEEVFDPKNQPNQGKASGGMTSIDL